MKKNREKRGIIFLSLDPDNARDHVTTDKQVCHCVILYYFFVLCHFASFLLCSLKTVIIHLLWLSTKNVSVTYYTHYTKEKNNTLFLTGVVEGMFYFDFEVGTHISEIREELKKDKRYMALLKDEIVCCLGQN